MKKLFYCLVLAALACACNTDSTASMAGSDTKTHISPAVWQKTIDKADDAIKKAFMEDYLEDKEAWDKVLKNAIDPAKLNLMDVYGFPVYNIDSALWASRQGLPLESYLKLDASKATFCITYEGQPVSRAHFNYMDGKWELDAYSRGGSAEEFKHVIPALNAGERVICVHLNPRHSSPYFIYAYQNGQWSRIDNAERHGKNVISDLQEFNRYILR
ncbi:MAG: hypothetical protein IKI72_05175 [Bacteroidales bacterium]|nr:hypothetical protein [Bacteroidales bacterium]